MLDKLKAKIRFMNKTVEVTTVDGVKIEVNAAGDQPAKGDKVNVADGSYVMPDGSTLIVANGVISDVVEAKPDDKPADAPVGGDNVDDKCGDKPKKNEAAPAEGDKPAEKPADEPAKGDDKVLTAITELNGKIDNLTSIINTLIGGEEDKKEAVKTVNQLKNAVSNDTIKAAAGVKNDGTFTLNDLRGL